MRYLIFILLFFVFFKNAHSQPCEQKLLECERNAMDLKNESLVLESLNKELIKKNNKLEEKIEELKNDTASLRFKIKLLGIQVENLKKEIENLKEKIRNLEARITSLEAEKQSLIGDTLRLYNENQSLKSDTLRLNGIILQMKKDQINYSMVIIATVRTFFKEKDVTIYASGVNKGKVKAKKLKDITLNFFLSSPPAMTEIIWLSITQNGRPVPNSSEQEIEINQNTLTVFSIAQTDFDLKKFKDRTYQIVLKNKQDSNGQEIFSPNISFK